MKPENVYVDPSALTRLYVHHAGSRDMAAWRKRLGGTLGVTHHGRTEIVNALSRAAFTKDLSSEGLAEALADLEADFMHGQLRQVDILWRAALNRATKLSIKYTPKLGARSLDVLHVACALELNLRHFLTFDTRQRHLAAAVGLKLISLSET